MSDDTSDDGDITITAESYKIHYSEKISTGEYENAQVDVTLEGSIDGVEIEDDIPHPVRARLLRAQKALQKDAQQAAENRVKIADSEDWTPQR